MHLVTNVGLGVLRVARRLPQRAEGLELLPSLIRLLEPLVARLPLGDQALPAPPARRSGATASVHGNNLHVDHQATLRPIPSQRVGLQVQVAAASGTTSGGDALHGLLLALAHGDLHRRRVLVLDGDQAVAGQDGDSLAAARDAGAPFGHPPAHAPVNRDGVQVFGSLLASLLLDVRQLCEVLLHVDHLDDRDELHVPSLARICRVQALRVKVHELPRHRELRFLADLHLHRCGRPDRGRLRIA
mmetsp:Transcript_50179/g.144601  ORF Transcript_50179/g.144601 Transcript_50179/m.144601 type:complete len:244 (+) Transcript_50179:863-1594(+)